MQVRLVAVMLLIAAACRQAAAGPGNPAVKTTKLVKVTGVKLPSSNPNSNPPNFTLPVFQHTTFSFASSCNHCRDATLTIKANAKGAPVITFVGPGPPPYNEKTTFTVTTSPPTITVVQSGGYNSKTDIYRFKADITSLYRGPVVSFSAYTRRLAVDSLNTVANNAATFIAYKHHFSGLPFPYSPHMRLVVAYLKHLAASSKGL